MNNDLYRLSKANNEFNVDYHYLTHTDFIQSESKI